MKSVPVLCVLALVLSISYVYADCNDDASKNADDGEVTQFFKNLGCKIKTGAEKLEKKAQPWAEKIGSSTKEFGSSVAQKYDELKHKLTDDDNKNEGPATPFPIANAPTEKVPLAPLLGEAGSAGAASQPAAAFGKDT